LKLILSDEYPNAPPRGFFLTKIYHPNIASNGDICVNTLKKDWTPEVTLKHVLQVIRCLLIVPFPESSLNDEAGKLFMDSYEEFARRARIMTSVHASVGCDGSTTGPAAASSSEAVDASVEGTNVSEEEAAAQKKQKAEKAAKKKSLKRL
jgi:ubiquitin-conjugating enzyme E2 S